MLLEQTSSAVFTDHNFVTISLDGLVNEGDDYRLYSSNNFGPIPEEGDLLGLVAHVVDLANAETSGVVMIKVTHRTVKVYFSNAIPYDRRGDFAIEAIEAAGLGKPSRFGGVLRPQSQV